MKNLPPFINTIIELGLGSINPETGRLSIDDYSVTKVAGIARIVEKLQPTSVLQREDTTAQEAIVLSTVLSSTERCAKELWSQLRVAFGMGHGQKVPGSLWTEKNFKAIAKEIDMIFLGQRTIKLLTQESLITSYQSLHGNSRSITIYDFAQIVSELAQPDTIDTYGDGKSEWDTALDILKQVRVKALLVETIHETKQSIKADTNIEALLKNLQSRSSECIGMLRGSVGSSAKAKTLIESVIGSPVDNEYNFVDRIMLAEKRTRPVSTGIPALDVDLQGGVSRPSRHRLTGGRVLTLAARTGIGKTSLGVHIATSLSHDGIATGFLSTELSEDAIMAKIISSMSRKLYPKHRWNGATNGLGYIGSNEIDNVSYDHRERIANCISGITIEMGNRDMFLTVEAPWAACIESCMDSMRAMKALNPDLRAVVVDHFHSISRHANAPRDNTMMLEERAYKLTTLAKELDIDIFLLAQCNQVGIKRKKDLGEGQKQSPELDVIRGTDALSHVSHAVWIVQRQKNDEGMNTGLLEIWHTKHRNGQQLWEGVAPNEQMVNVVGSVEKSIINFDLNTCSLIHDDTSEQLKPQEKWKL